MKSALAVRYPRQSLPPPSPTPRLLAPHCAINGVREITLLYAITLGFTRVQWQYAAATGRVGHVILLGLKIGCVRSCVWREDARRRRGQARRDEARTTRTLMAALARRREHAARFTSRTDTTESTSIPSVSALVCLSHPLPDFPHHGHQTRRKGCTRTWSRVTSHVKRADIQGYRRQ